MERLTEGGLGRLARVLGGLAVGLVIVVALLLATLAVALRTSSGGTARVLGHPVLVILSGSMHPTFEAGDVIVERPVGAEEANRLRVGDVVTFQPSTARGGTAPIPLTHRIVSVRPAAYGTVSYRTRGDANNAADGGVIAPDQVLGVYQWRIPWLGFVLDFAHRPLWLAVAVLTLLTVYLAGEVISELRPRPIAIKAPARAGGNQMEESHETAQEAAHVAGGDPGGADVGGGGRVWHQLGAVHRPIADPDQ